MGEFLAAPKRAESAAEGEFLCLLRRTALSDRFRPLQRAARIETIKRKHRTGSVILEKASVGIMAASMLAFQLARKRPSTGEFISMTPTVRRRWVVLVIAMCVLFYGTLHFLAAHSEGRVFLEQTIRKSVVVKSRVGDVQQIRFGIFDAYSEKFAGSDRWVTMTVHVVGTKGEVTVKAAAKKGNGVWAASDASIDGTPISLN